MSLSATSLSVSATSLSVSGTSLSLSETSLSPNNWIEDERDTRHYIVYENSKIKQEEYVKPLGEILKEYYKEEQEMRYNSCTYDEYKRERQKVVIKPNKPRKIHRVYQQEQVSKKECCEEEEFNGGLLEQAIYKKCWYS